MSKNIKEKNNFLAAAFAKFGRGGEFHNPEMLELVASTDFPRYAWNWVFNPEYRVQRGLFRLPADFLVESTKTVTAKKTKTVSPTSADVSPNMAAVVVPMIKNTETPKKFDPNAISEHNYAVVPSKDKHYVPFGEFQNVEKIIKSGMFFPVFISGLSGNGKTFMVEQAAARSKRPMIRVQMSRETDEDDLIGGFRLINGETKFLKGPVLRAMELGSLLLIDEADRADPGKVMCLQGILEGKPYYVKKTGEVITPAAGFNIIVTANTKGKGSDDGRYVAASILDDAWLERFPITVEQKYPIASVEKRIVRSYLCDDRECTEDDTKFVEYLCNWAEVIRKTFDEDAIDEVISTRRLVHIAQTYKIFGDKMQSIRLCINRFDEETKTAFLDLYAKVDETLAPPTPVMDPPAPAVDPSNSPSVPF
jgi:MoxR-like ATPase